MYDSPLILTPAELANFDKQKPTSITKNPGATDMMLGLLAGTILLTTSNAAVGALAQAHPGLRCLPSLHSSTSEAALFQLVLPALCNSIVVGS